MTTPGVETATEPRPETEPGDSADASGRGADRKRPKTRGRLLAFAGGFILLAALLWPVFEVQTPGRGAVDLTLYNQLALAAAAVGAVAAFVHVVNPGRFAVLMPLLFGLAPLGFGVAAVLGVGTTTRYAVGPGIGAYLALAGGLVTFLGGVRGLPVLWRR